MGFWYFLILLIGILFLIVGALKKDVSRSVKIVIMLFIFGILFIVVSVFMFMPGSAEIISELLRLN
jgi:energy-coupling factor transporter transmembrane protein EcfT